MKAYSFKNGNIVIAVKDAEGNRLFKVLFEEQDGQLSERVVDTRSYDEARAYALGEKE